MGGPVGCASEAVGEDGAGARLDGEAAEALGDGCEAAGDARAEATGGGVDVQARDATASAASVSEVSAAVTSRCDRSIHTLLRAGPYHRQHE
jgi:hypothetical protein